MNINDTIVLLIKWSFFELKKLPTTFIQSTSRIICQLSYIKFNKFVVCIVNNNALVCLWIKLLWEIAIILNERKEMNLFKQGDSLGETERWIRIILWIVYFLFCFVFQRTEKVTRENISTINIYLLSRNIFKSIKTFYCFIFL